MQRQFYDSSQVNLLIYKFKCLARQAANVLEYFCLKVSLGKKKKPLANCRYLKKESLQVHVISAHIYSKFESNVVTLLGLLK